jgi:hypothetical protein
MHVQTLFRDRHDSGPARRVADRGIEPDPLRLERLTLLFEGTKRSDLTDAIRSPCNDARSDQDETKQSQREDGSCARG